MGRWDAVFATVVRQNLDTEGWVHLLKDNVSEDLSLAWLVADADLIMSKTVINCIGRLDRESGRGMGRAVKWMKALRQGYPPPPSGTSVANPATVNTPQTRHLDPHSGPPPLAPGHSLPTVPPAIVVSDHARRPVIQLNGGPTVGPGSHLDPPKLPSPRDDNTAFGSTVLDPRSLSSGHLSVPSKARPPKLAPPPRNLTPQLPPTPIQTPSPTSPPVILPAPVLRSAIHPSIHADGLLSRRVERSAVDILTSAGSRLFTGTPVVSPINDRLGGGELGLEAALTTPLVHASDECPPPRVVRESVSVLDEPIFPDVKNPDADPDGEDPDISVPGGRAKVASRIRRSATPWEGEDEVRATAWYNQEGTNGQERMSDEGSIGNSEMSDQKDEAENASDDENDAVPGAKDDEMDESECDSEDNYQPDDSQSDTDPDLEQDEEVELPNNKPHRVQKTKTIAKRKTAHDQSPDSEADLSDEAASGKKMRKRRGDDFGVNLPKASAWTKEENDYNLKDWGLERAIDFNPQLLAPIRTKWMYEARLKDMTEEDYAKQMDLEYQELLTIPPACRSTVGQHFHRRLKGDWELRVVLTILAWRYAQVKVKKEDAREKDDRLAERDFAREMTTILDNGLNDLYKRFPDVHPNHERRQIRQKEGGDAVTSYVQSIRTKVTSDAGRMCKINRENKGTLGMLEARSSSRKLLGIMDILGKKRKDVAFHLWGGSMSGGREECDAEIEHRMKKWKKKNPLKTSREISTQSLVIVCEVRRELFLQLPTKVQSAWEEKAKTLHLPQSEEDSQCLVDAVLPYLYRLLKHLSDQTSLHFVLLASGQGTSNVPVLIHEFLKSGDNQSSFLGSDSGLSQRVRSDYLDYAVKHHNAALEDIIEGLPVVHTTEDDINEHDHQDDLLTVPRSDQLIRPDESPIAPFAPTIKDASTPAFKLKYVSSWLLRAAAKILKYSPDWDEFCQNILDWVDPSRLPPDPLVPGKPLEIGKPSAMHKKRFNALWQFLIDSYNGKIPPEKRFAFKIELLHLNLPSVPVPADPSVHQASVNAERTQPMKKKSGPKEIRSVVKGQAIEDSDALPSLLDGPGISEDIDAALLEAALQSGASGQKRTQKNMKLPLASTNRAVNGVRVQPPGKDPGGMRATEKPAGDRSLKERPAEETRITERSAGGRSVAGRSAGGQPVPGQAVAEKSLAMDVEACPKRAVPRETTQGDPVAVVEIDKEPAAPSRPRPRPRGPLPPATDALDHPSLLLERQAIAGSWKETLAKLKFWGQRMGLGTARGKVLPFQGLVKRNWSSLLPTGLDSASCIVQISSTYQTSSAIIFNESDLTGLEGISLNHPVSLALRTVLDPAVVLPSAKFFNVQFGTSVEGNNAFFDFLEGTVTNLTRQIYRSEDTLLKGNVDVFQLIRLGTVVSRSGYMRDLGAASAHTERTIGVTDQLNIVLAALALVRYYHVMLARTVEAFIEDESIAEEELKMWRMMKQVWKSAVGTMARAVVARRSDLFDRAHIFHFLTPSLGHLLETILSIRPWWSPGDDGLPAAISFTTKQSLASPSFYSTIEQLEWSELSLLERGLYMLLVFLAAVQIHRGRVPDTRTPLGLPERTAWNSSESTLNEFIEFLGTLAEVVMDSEESGLVEPPVEDRRHLPSVLACIQRWKEESRLADAPESSANRSDQTEAIASESVQECPMPETLPWVLVEPTDGPGDQQSKEGVTLQEATEDLDIPKISDEQVQRAVAETDPTEPAKRVETESGVDRDIGLPPARPSVQALQQAPDSPTVSRFTETSAVSSVKPEDEDPIWPEGQRPGGPAAEGTNATLTAPTAKSTKGRAPPALNAAGDMIVAAHDPSSPSFVERPTKRRRLEDRPAEPSGREPSNSGEGRQLRPRSRLPTTDATTRAVRSGTGQARVTRRGVAKRPK
ncbi:hypothetical protein FRB90_007324 [Tulasnella sp. 427]|nr:hypothetical protein FRB90_007324 [Tulasnella sp. 427]